ncbi:MAG: hypothetical protein CL728_05250 [Chloroflexi bacterium]|nr:hypothetical protein [Chloroflexota bacterium]|tara:strand:+ start:144 stop:524 length:381 start_codon:yes stop_codon:yes gene_type:complete
MKPSSFFKKLTNKINELDPEKKKELFTKSNLGVLKRISEYCQKEKKVIVITDKDECVDFYKILREFDLSIYYTRRGWAIFLTNFNRQKFTRIKDDRYRFLKRIYPDSGEYRRLEEKRDKFFKDVLR